MNDLFRAAGAVEAGSMKKELREHQVRAIQQVRQSFGKGNRRVVLQGPTGFGKTLTAAKIIEGALAKGSRVIFTAPAVSLINQTVDAFEAEGIRDIGVMQANHPRTDAYARVQVASVQTLARRDIPQASLVIVDECHHQSKVVLDMMQERPDVFFLGMTATPWAKGMGLQWQDLCIPVTIGELIEAGYLSQFRVLAPDVPDLSGVKSRAGEYDEAQLEEIMGGGIVASVVQTWLEKADNRPTLVFGVNCAHAESLHRQFMGAGVSSAYINAAVDSIERQIIERQFRAGDVQVVCSVRTMTTGVDWPVSCIVDAAPTRSPILHVQKIGRGLRVNPGTEDLLVLDHAGNSLRLGLVTDIHRTRLDDGERKPKGTSEGAEKLPKECGNCGTLHIGKICPMCGHERKPPPSDVEEREGELVELTPGRKSEPTKADKQKFWSMALWLDADRQKGGKLAKGLYKGKFGVWPKNLEDIPTHPDQAFWNYEKASRIRYAKRTAKQEGRA